MALFKDGYIYWKRGEEFLLSPNFLSREFECPCGTCEVQKISLTLVGKLQDLRDFVEEEVAVTKGGGFRCGAYQQHLRDAKNPDGTPMYETAVGVSEHELGDAADIKKTSDRTRFMWALQQRFKAIGDGGTWTHVGLRRDRVRRWEYSKTGAQDAPGKTN